MCEPTCDILLNAVFPYGLQLLCLSQTMFGEHKCSVESQTKFNTVTGASWNDDHELRSSLPQTDSSISSWVNHTHQMTVSYFCRIYYTPLWWNRANRKHLGTGGKWVMLAAHPTTLKAILKSHIFLEVSSEWSHQSFWLSFCCLIQTLQDSKSLHTLILWLKTQI